MFSLQGVIFDMDGLLLDTERMALSAWQESAARYGYEVDEAFFRTTVGGNAERTKQRYLEQFGESFPYEEVRSQRIQLMDRWLEEQGVGVKPGVRELLQYLQQAGVRSGVATSTSRARAERLLTKAGLVAYFDQVVGGDEVKVSKPDPEIYLKAAAALGFQPEGCLVFEDSPLGIQAACAAGMRVVMVPDLILPDETIEKMFFGKIDSLLDAKNQWQSLIE